MRSPITDHSFSDGVHLFGWRWYLTLRRLFSHRRRPQARYILDKVTEHFVVSSHVINGRVFEDFVKNLLIIGSELCLAFRAKELGYLEDLLARILLNIFIEHKEQIGIVFVRPPAQQPIDIVPDFNFSSDPQFE